MSSLERLPRELNPFERELLLWVLPKERPGYAEYRKLIETWPVASVGRRGEGNYILAETGWNVDTESPLPQVFAYGVLEHERGVVTISIRERTGGQLEFEMEGVADPAAVASLRQIRRWSFSEWLPAQPCPSCRSSVREIRMTTTASQTLVLVLCDKDRRIWVYDGQSGVNSLIPVTGFYNELMLQKGIHDPKIALDPTRLFQIPGAQSESELIRAFSSYNKLRNKIVLEGELVVAGKRQPNWIQRTLAALAGKQEQTRQR
jgi:hypothetical protein